MVERHSAHGPRLASLLSSLLFLVFSIPAYAQSDWAAVMRPTLAVSPAAGDIEIDGVLSDPGWQGAARASNFAEHHPGDQTKPAVDTEVWVTYDDTHLYVAWICQDDPKSVRASFCERDNIFDDDYVILCLDPYGDATLAYEIAANPYGIPGDLLFSTANGEDISYDIIFESSGRVTENGWVVEMAVPFASFRFPNQENQTWRVDFWRNRPRESRFQYSWAAYDRDESCWPCQWGTITGVNGVKPGAGFELLPYVLGYQSGSLNGDSQFENYDVDGEAGIGITYDVSSDLSTEATINPDFSQVESDAAQIDVNSTFALFYPEKRPFFQEGSDLFETYFEAVYTRSINDPLGAGKFTWRNGSNSMAFLTGYDEHSPLILPFEESSRIVENGESYSNILRARRDFGEQSHVGLIGTDRRFDGGGSGSLVGADGQLHFSPSNTFRFQVLATHTEEVNNLALTDSAFNETRFDDGKYTSGLDGEKFWGYGAYAKLVRETRSYWLAADYWEKSPTFRADNGFEPSNNYRMPSVEAGAIKRFEDESDLVQSISANVEATRKWNFDGVKKDEWVMTNLEGHLRAAQTGFHAMYMASNELYNGIQFDGIWQAHGCLSVRPVEALSFGGNYNYGHRIARRQLVMGKETNVGVWADIKPIDRLLLAFAYARVTSDDVDTDERLFSQSVFRTRIGFQILRELSARLILQYNDRYDTWDVDPLVTYRLNPFSIFYVGSARNYQDFDQVESGLDGWTLTDRQYFVKLQYLFQL
jgi:hypothetical protein